MNIKIGKYILQSDANQFILKEKKIRKEGDKKGEAYFDRVGCYPSIESVLKAVPDRVLMRSDAKTLKELLFEFQEYKRILIKALK